MVGRDNGFEVRRRCGRLLLAGALAAFAARVPGALTEIRRATGTIEPFLERGETGLGQHNWVAELVAKVVAAQAQQQPVVSVDTKKKELIGNFKNGGTDYRPKGDPRRVNVHDFEDKKLGKVVPYGVYDVTANAGFVSVGITSDTAEFAVQSIRCWRERMGRQRYPNARELTIMADCGGSNGARVRLWKLELQKLADQTGLVIHVHHYPPGTSKWNKIEHRMFCHITQNWRGRPLTDRLAVVELIGATTTKTGLKVESALDTRSYQKGIKVSKAAMKSLDITGDPFHPEWNYTIRPRQPPKL